jgi:hypothetical protein
MLRATIPFAGYKAFAISASKIALSLSMGGSLADGTNEGKKRRR